MSEIIPTTTTTTTTSTSSAAEPHLPRVTIQFCTQCKWMLRAAYYAQELLSTFSLSLGEVVLQPSTGGVFIVSLTTAVTLTNAPTLGGNNSSSDAPAQEAGELQPTVAAQQTQRTVVLWDRKVDGGFPETKELKRRVRDVVEPGRGLGHVDRDYGRKKGEEGKAGGEGKMMVEAKQAEGGSKVCTVGETWREKCEDCE